MHTQEKINLISTSRYATKRLRLTVANRLAYYAAKRVMDLLIASCLLICLLPVMILIGLAIFIYPLHKKERQ